MMLTARPASSLFAASISWLILCVLITPALHAAPVLNVETDYLSTKIDRYIDVLVDETRSLDVSDLASDKYRSRFSPLTLERPEFGFTDATVWLRITLRNATEYSDRYSLLFQPINISALTVFDAKSEAGLQSYEQLWDLADKRENRLPTMSPGFLINLGHFNPNEVRNIYIKLESKHPLNIHSSLFSSSSLGAEMTSSNSYYTFLLGGLWVVFLISLLCILYSRECMFLCVSLYVLAVIGFLRSAWGYPAFLVLGEAVHHGLAVYAYGSLMPVFLLAITRQLIIKTQVAKTSSIVLLFFIALNAIACLATLFFLDERASFYLFYIANVSALIAALIAVLVVYSKRHKDYLLLQAICYSLMLIVIAANVLTAIVDLSMVVMGDKVIGSITVVVSILAMISVVLFKAGEQRRAFSASLRNTFNDELISNQTSLLSKLTHEIRTPMAGVLGMSELLRSTNMSESQTEFADNIDRSAQELLHIIDDVTAFAHIQNGTLPIQKQSFSIIEMLDDLMMAFAPEAERKNIELVSFVEPGQPSYVEGDQVRTRHIISNLISHCIAHLRDGEVVIRAMAGDGQLVITVEDNGPGMSSEDLAQLFVEGDELSNIIPQQGGIGLPLSKRIAHALGGSLQANSLLLEGTLFTLNLPVGDCQKPLTNAVGVDQLRELRILVVDDSSTYCDVVERQIMHWGSYVDSCMSGSEAFALLRANENIQQPYDVLLVDYSMPGMNGLQLAERIKNDDLIQDQNLLIVMLTGLNTMPDIKLAQKLGIRRIVHKPLSSKALQKLLLAEMSADASQVEKKVVADSSLDQTQSIHVLLAEDNDISARVMERMLQRLNVNVELVENGEDALRALQRSKFDLVLMDCEMPIMDGFEATELARRWEAESGRPRTAIIALTAHLLEQLQDRIKEAGMDDQVSKPLRINELESLLQRWIPAYRVKDD